MNRRWFLAGLAVLVVAGGAAEARMHAPYRGHRIVPATAVAPPLDGLTTPTGGYSFHKLLSTYAGPALRLRRASDNAELDINFVPGIGAPWDEAAAIAHCSLTTCFGRSWYDNSGASRHLQQATAANQLQLIFNCKGTLPCWRATTSTQTFLATGFTPTTGVMSFSAVANRSAGTGNCAWMRGNGNANRLQSSVGAGNWSLVGAASGTITAPAADAAWHAAVAAMTGTAASYLSIDGTVTAGTSTGNTTGGAPGVAGAASTTCDIGEAVFWDNYLVAPAEAAALIANQRGFWGTP